MRRRKIGRWATAAILLAFMTPSVGRAITITEAYQDYLVELATKAKIAGSCERYLRPGYTEAFKVAIFDDLRDAADGELKSGIQALLVQKLEDGRASPITGKDAARRCARMMAETEAELAKAEDLLEAVRRATRAQ